MTIGARRKTAASRDEGRRNETPNEADGANRAGAPQSGRDQPLVLKRQAACAPSAATGMITPIRKWRADAERASTDCRVCCPCAETPYAHHERNVLRRREPHHAYGLVCVCVMLTSESYPREYRVY